MVVVNHQHRFVFIKSKKTAGTSVELALSRFAGPRCVLTPNQPADERLRLEAGYRGAQNWQKPLRDRSPAEMTRWLLGRGAPARFERHMSAQAARGVLGEEIWRSYFTFSIVRDPFDYAVSLYFWREKPRERTLAEHAEDFQLFVERNEADLDLNRTLIDIDGEPGVDFVVRYEDLPSDLDRVSEKIGLPVRLSEVLAGFRAKGGHRAAGFSRSDIYLHATRARDMVAAACRVQIERYGYSIPAA